jgi:hypothetical protein
MNRFVILSQAFRVIVESRSTDLRKSTRRGRNSKCTLCTLCSFENTCSESQKKLRPCGPCSAPKIATLDKKKVKNRVTLMDLLRYWKK